MGKTIYFLFLLCSKHGYSSSATFLAVGKPASIVAWEVYLFPLIGLAFLFHGHSPWLPVFNKTNVRRMEVHTANVFIIYFASSVQTLTPAMAMAKVNQKMTSTRG